MMNAQGLVQEERKKKTGYIMLICLVDDVIRKKDKRNFVISRNYPSNFYR